MARISGVVIALNEAHQLHYALSTLLPEMRFEPLDPAEMAAHKRDVVQMVRRLLGYRSPRRLHSLE